MSLRCEDLAAALLDWFDAHGRHDLPWQHPRSAYRVWVSEIMLQQTQVATVVGYFERFMQRFPDLRALATADLDDVLAAWSGLGYYRRARFLHQAARRCVELHEGDLPRDLESLQALPGIGRSTAGAIVAQAFGQPAPILDGNVKRVLSRLHGVEGWPGERVVEKALWSLADAQTPKQRVADYTQAIMDLGATVCTRSRPRCTACPWMNACQALREGRTDQLPTPPPKRAVPRRAAKLLVLLHGGRVLLHRRPPTGVWPELWSLPQHEADAVDWIGVLPDDIVVSMQSAPRDDAPFEHRFTHFALSLQPQILLLPACPPGAILPGAIRDGDRWRWASRAEALELGLPAPIRTYLSQLIELGASDS